MACGVSPTFVVWDEKSRSEFYVFPQSQKSELFIVSRRRRRCWRREKSVLQTKSHFFLFDCCWCWNLLGCMLNIFHRWKIFGFWGSAFIQKFKRHVQSFTYAYSFNFKVAHIFRIFLLLILSATKFAMGVTQHSFCHVWLREYSRIPSCWVQNIVFRPNSIRRNFLH